MCRSYHPLSTDVATRRELAFTRRQFLHSGLAMVSTLATVPGFLSRSSMAMADTTMRTTSKSGVPEDRVLVVVQLTGGNDGLNTVVPFGMDAYRKARPGVGVPDNEVIPVDEASGIGLHRQLQPIHEMMGEGIAAVVQGVGYPNPNRSHFESMDIWHAADPVAGDRGSRGRGWIGRALDREKDDRAGLACVAIGDTAPLAAQGERTRPVTFEDARLFRWAANDLHDDLAAAYQQLQQGPAEGSDPAAFLHRTAMDAQVASARIRKAVSKSAETRFPGGRLAEQLQTVAAMIRAGLPTRVYYVALGGFDTHAGQGGTHPRLLGQFAEAMRAFYAELAATGDRSRVVTIAFSEFGRRLRQNSSGGTDHGAAGPMFVFGERVRAGLIGEHPSLAAGDLDDGDLVHRTDFRSVYAEVLDRWMGLDSAAALGGRFAAANVLRA